jgi:hypothetical protein
MEMVDAVIAVFADHNAAEAAVKKLAAAGFAMKNLHVVGKRALGATLHGIGVPKDVVDGYEAAMKADGFLVMAHGAVEEIARAKAILHAATPSRLEVHSGVRHAHDDQGSTTPAEPHPAV